MKTTPMQVTLVDHMGSDLSVVNAARVSFDKESEWDRVPVDRGWDDEAIAKFEKLNYTEIPPRTGIDFVLKGSDAKLIGYLAKHNHWSPFAHTSIQLRVKAPIFVARQLVKHQVGGVWNEVSRRYVDSEPEFYFPDVWRGRPEGSIKQGSSGVVDIGVCCSNTVIDHPPDPNHPDGLKIIIAFGLNDLVSHNLALYQDMLDKGVAPEQARMILPQNMMTEWYWTGSLMFFCRVCRERLAPGAQQETREVAEQIAEIVAPLYPVAWSALMES